ncbi:MAG: SHOCT domain-containing protein [Desulfobulbaceae bacterium]|jgi:putative membrane protein|nr:SHOCT domain-containing protein [Desulfobulbaceae bacterium]
MMNFSGHYNNWLCGSGAFSHGPFGIILALLFWGLVIYLLVRVFQAIFRSTGSDDLDILKKRYAKGEISEEEFKRMKADLE